MVDFVPGIHVLQRDTIFIAAQVCLSCRLPLFSLQRAPGAVALPAAGSLVPSASSQLIDIDVFVSSWYG